MGILDLFSRKKGCGRGKPDWQEFVDRHVEQEHRVFVTTRENGRRVAMAFGPLTKHLNKYNSEVEDGLATILVEGEASPATGTWWQGTDPDLSWDRSKPVGRDPFAAGNPVMGTLNFTQVGTEAPFYKAHGLAWWADGDGKTLRTQLHYLSLPEARLVWKLYDPESVPAEPGTRVPGIELFIGAWSRSHCVEGTVVADPTEGCGFAVEGGESRFEALTVWSDGLVTVSGDSGDHRGRLRDGGIAWEKPAKGEVPEGVRSSLEYFEPFDGPVELDGDDLLVGGFRFGRVAETEPE